MAGSKPFEIERPALTQGSRAYDYREVGGSVPPSDDLFPEGVVDFSLVIDFSKDVNFD